MLDGIPAAICGADRWFIADRPIAGITLPPRQLPRAVVGPVLGRLLWPDGRAVLYPALFHLGSAHTVAHQFSLQTLARAWRWLQGDVPDNIRPRYARHRAGGSQPVDRRDWRRDHRGDACTLYISAISAV